MLTLSTYSFSDIVALIAAGSNEASEAAWLDSVTHDALACHEIGAVEPYADIQDRFATAYNFGKPVVLGGERGAL